MIDTRCFNCAAELEIINENSPINIDGYSEYEYKGGGIFKCPECYFVLDLSNSTYITIVQRKYDEFGELETEILETDRRLKGDKKDGFETDMYELDIFEDLPVGIYKLDVLWFYYECGGYDCAEWDVKIEILSDEEIDISEFKDKQKHLRMWRDYNRDRVHTKIVKEIETGIV